jgi:hypothetical protein
MVRNNPNFGVVDSNFHMWFMRGLFSYGSVDVMVMVLDL